MPLRAALRRRCWKRLSATLLCPFGIVVSRMMYTICVSFASRVWRNEAYSGALVPEPLVGLAASVPFQLVAGTRGRVAGKKACCSGQGEPQKRRCEGHRGRVGGAIAWNEGRAVHGAGRSM